MWPRDNSESWQKIHVFIDAYPEDAYWSKWKSMVRGVVSALEARGLVTVFRIGQSMHEIMISTSDRHGLPSGAPRVILEFHPKEDRVRIAYSYANLIFQAPVSQERVPCSDAVTSVLRYLRRLWNETKPSTPLPDALNVS